MKIDLKGKNALVGGSSKGLGRAIAERLAASGANVTLMARNEEELKKRLSSLDQSQGQIHQYRVVDFSNFDEFSKHMDVFFQN